MKAEKYLFTLRKLFMAGLEKFRDSPKVKYQNQSELSPQEIELILKLLATTSFPVKDIEILYQTIFKLQELHKNGITK